MGHRSDLPPVDTELKPRRGIFRFLALFLIRLYRRILSPVMGGQCRFYPTCSYYAELSFTYLPLHEAAWRSVDRVIRCRPGQPGGIDFPPGLRDGSEKSVLESRDLVFTPIEKQKKKKRNR